MPAAALAALLLFTACSGPVASQPDPIRVLRDAGKAMAGIKSVKDLKGKKVGVTRGVITPAHSDELFQEFLKWKQSRPAR